MHTVELLQEALHAAQRLGYQVRHEWLGGSGGGACEIKGRKCLFLDLALGPDDQLQQVLDSLRREPPAALLGLSEPLRRALQLGARPDK
ncbi:MAG: hypothetical protein ACUVUC_08565 [Thermoguttaceae bacterium]